MDFYGPTLTSAGAVAAAVPGTPQEFGGFSTMFDDWGLPTSTPMPIGKSLALGSSSSYDLDMTPVSSASNNVPTLPVVEAPPLTWLDSYDVTMNAPTFQGESKGPLDSPLMSSSRRLSPQSDDASASSADVVPQFSLEDTPSPSSPVDATMAEEKPGRKAPRKKTKKRCAPYLSQKQREERRRLKKQGQSMARRREINNLFDTIKGMVGSDQKSQGDILVDVLAYMRGLQDKLSTLRSQAAALEKDEPIQSFTSPPSPVQAGNTSPIVSVSSPSADMTEFLGSKNSLDFNKVMRNAAVPIAVIDKEGQLLDINQAFLDYFGGSRVEFAKHLRKVLGRDRTGPISPPKRSVPASQVRFPHPEDVPALHMFLLTSMDLPLGDYATVSCRRINSSAKVVELVHHIGWRVPRPGAPDAAAIMCFPEEC